MLAETKFLGKSFDVLINQQVKELHSHLHICTTIDCSECNVYSWLYLFVQKGGGGEFAEKYIRFL